MLKKNPAFFHELIKPYLLIFANRCQWLTILVKLLQIQCFISPLKVNLYKSLSFHKWSFYYFASRSDIRCGMIELTKGYVVRFPNLLELLKYLRAIGSIKKFKWIFKSSCFVYIYLCIYLLSCNFQSRRETIVCKKKLHTRNNPSTHLQWRG